MKKFTVAALILGAFAVGFASNNFAISAGNTDFKYAVVDLQKVVASSKQVNTLKNEQTTKLRELSQFVQNANKQIEAENDSAKKVELEKTLNKQLNQKKQTIEKNYAGKLAAIDKNISLVIANTAREQNYNLVLAKGVVLYGGDDITASVMKNVK